MEGVAEPSTSAPPARAIIHSATSRAVSYTHLDVYKRQAKRKRKRLIASASFIIAVVAALAILFFTTDVIVPNASYNAAARLLSEKNYDSAYSAFLKLGTYRGSDQAAQECALQAAQSALDSEEFATLERWYSRIDRKNEIDGSIREKASQLSSESKLGSAAGLYQIIGDEEAENQKMCIRDSL